MSIQKITGTFLLGVSLLSPLSAQDARSTHWDFNDVQSGKLPSGWIIDATHAKKPLAAWEVIQREYLLSQEQDTCTQQGTNLLRKIPIISVIPDLFLF